MIFAALTCEMIRRQTVGALSARPVQLPGRTLLAVAWLEDDGGPPPREEVGFLSFLPSGFIVDRELKEIWDCIPREFKRDLDYSSFRQPTPTSDLVRSGSVRSDSLADTR